VAIDWDMLDVTAGDAKDIAIGVKFLLLIEPHRPTGGDFVVIFGGAFRRFGPNRLRGFPE